MSNAALKADILFARMSTVRGLAGEHAQMLQDMVLAELDQRLSALDKQLRPLADAARTSGKDLDSTARSMLGAIHAQHLAGPRPTRQAARTAAGWASNAISFQGENLARFRTIAQGVLAFGGLSALLAVFLFIRAQRAAADLRRSQERYYHLFESNAAIMLLVDPRTRRVVEGNRAAQEFYGWTSHELRDKAIAEINLGPQELLADAMQEAQSGKRRRFDFRHRRADGSIVDVEVLVGASAIG